MAHLINDKSNWCHEFLKMHDCQCFYLGCVTGKKGSIFNSFASNTEIHVFCHFISIFSSTHLFANNTAVTPLLGICSLSLFIFQRIFLFFIPVFTIGGKKHFVLLTLCWESHTFCLSVDWKGEYKCFWCLLSPTENAFFTSVLSVSPCLQINIFISFPFLPLPPPF